MANLNQSFYKLLIVLLPLVVIALINSKETSRSANIDAFKVSLKNKKSSDSTYYFIGSSRVKASINDTLLKTYYKNIDIQNLGISGATFLENCIIANFLISQKGFKKIYVELSPLQNDVPDQFLQVCEELDIDPIFTAKKIFSFSDLYIAQIVLDIINSRNYSILSLKSVVKRVLNYKHAMQLTDWFGYSPGNGSNNVDETPIFLVATDFKDHTKKVIINLNEYRHAINHLISKGKNNQTEIIFFLPMTYTKRVEKDLCTSIFNSLQMPNKLTFTDEFIDQMSDSKFLFDMNHYNFKGSMKYTELLFYQMTRPGLQSIQLEELAL